MPYSLNDWKSVARVLFVLNFLFWTPVIESIAEQDQSSSDKSSIYYENAVTLFHTDDLRGAFIELKNALQSNPKDLAARILLGQVHLKLRDGASAEKELKKALQMGADRSLANPILARALLLQGKHDEIIEKMSAAGYDDKAKSALLTVRGQAYTAKQNVKAAKTAFDRASKLATNSADPQIGLVRLYILTDELDVAEDHVDLATSLEPENSEAWTLKGELRRFNADLERALDYYSKAIRLEPSNTEARVGRAACLVDLKRHSEALEDINEILEQIPHHTPALYLKVLIVAQARDLTGGQALIADVSETLSKLDPGFVKKHPPSTLLAGVTRFVQGNFEEARIHLKHYISIIPQNTLARKLYAKILLQTNDYEAAVDILEPALTLSPDDPVLLTLLGNAYLKKKRFNEATILLEKVNKLMPENRELLTSLAMGHLGQGQQEKAIKELQTAITVDPEEIKARKLLALIFMKQEKLDEAIQLVDRALSVNPKDPALHNLAGVIYIKKDEPAKARASFERAVEHDPTFVTAQSNLANIDWAEGNPELAAKRYRSILEKDPGNIQIILRLVGIAESHNSPDEAISLLEKIEVVDDKTVEAQAHLIDLYLSIDKPEAALATAERLSYREPTNFAVLIGHSKAHLAMNQEDKAIDTLRTTSVLYSEHPKKLAQIAKFQFAINDIEGASKSLNQALEIESDFLPAMELKARIALAENEFDEALAQANNLILRDKTSMRGEILKGDILMRKNRFRDALNAYQEARKKQNNSATTKRIYLAQKALNGTDQALASLEKWIESQPSDNTDQQTLAGAYLQAGKYTQAQETYEQLLKSVPENAVILNSLAWIYYKQGNPNALKYAVQAHTIAPNSAAVLDTLGWLLVQNGESSRALKYLREAYGRESNQAVVNYHIGVALHRLGRKSEARQQLRKALQLNDQFDGASGAKALLSELGD